MLKEAMARFFGPVPEFSAGLMLQSKIKGIDLAVYEGQNDGEYDVYLRFNGKNPDYPADIADKRLTLFKSPDQFNLSKGAGGSTIAQNCHYSRVVIDTVTHRTKPDGDMMLPSKVDGSGLDDVHLCAMVYVRDAQGKETLWCGMGLDNVYMPHADLGAHRKLTVA